MSIKTRVWAIAGLAVLVCLFTAGFATANSVPGPTVTAVNVGSVTAAQSIDNLIIDGTNYDVTFGVDTLDSTFLNNSAGATDAVSAINAVLNDPYADVAALDINLYIAAGTFAVLVDNNLLGPDNLTSSYIDNAAWAPGPNGYEEITAQFAQVPAPPPPAVTPEPASLLLFGTGLLGLALVIRRKRSATVES